MRRGHVTRRNLLGALATLAAVSALAGCKIVPIGEADKPVAFDAVGYAAALWETRALPHFKDAGHPITEVVPAIVADIADAGTRFGYRPATEGSAWTFIVTGQGVVTATNTESRAGTVTLSVAGVASDVTIQIGPVIRGNAIRDSLPFVSFKDFTNQLEFADVGKALTALAVAAIPEAVRAAKVGDTIAFTGAMSLNASSDRLLVTPVTLQVSP